jgi:DNA-cytosine methyltransferase
MLIAVTFFAGAGGACKGLEQAGYKVIWANEFNPDAADIWRSNHPTGILDPRDILDLPIADIPDADVHWYSPPCQLYSLANPNRNGGTEEEDTRIAQKIAKIIKAKRPAAVIIENVPGYANSKSLPIILDALESIGHTHKSLVLNSADYGTPQTRQRLIIRSSGGKLGPIAPTHSKTQSNQMSLFGDRLLPWVGWYEAIEDLLPTLRSGKLTEPQQQELERQGLLNHALIDGKANKYGSSNSDRAADEPAYTITASAGTRQISKIVLVQLTGYYDRPAIKLAHEPVWTITASQGHDRRVRKNGHSSFRSMASIALPDQVLRPDVRCLARWQGFPDGYVWSPVDSVSAKAIGNAVAVNVARAAGLSLLG